MRKVEEKGVGVEVSALDEIARRGAQRKDQLLSPLRVAPIAWNLYHIGPSTTCGFRRQWG